MVGQANEQSLPAGWPEGVSLPTEEEAEEAVREGEEKIVRDLEALKERVRPLDGEGLQTVIDI